MLTNGIILFSSTFLHHKVLCSFYESCSAIFLGDNNEFVRCQTFIFHNVYYLNLLISSQTGLGGLYSVAHLLNFILHSLVFGFDRFSGMLSIEEGVESCVEVLGTIGSGSSSWLGCCVLKDRRYCGRAGIAISTGFLLVGSGGQSLV